MLTKTAAQNILYQKRFYYDIPTYYTYMYNTPTSSRKRCKNVIKFYFCNWIVFRALIILFNFSLFLHVPDDISSHVEHFYLLFNQKIYFTENGRTHCIRNIMFGSDIQIWKQDKSNTKRWIIKIEISHASIHCENVFTAFR